MRMESRVDWFIFFHITLSSLHIPFLFLSLSSSSSSFSLYLSPMAMATATFKSLASASPLSHSPHHPPLPLRSVVASLSRPNLLSSFNGQSLQLHRRLLRAPMRRCSQTSRPIVMMVKPTIQFIQGTDELTIPDVRLTKSRDGSNGMAIFRFDQPSVFDASGEVGDITGLYMIDEEGILQSVDVNAKFVNGKPAGIEAKYVMRTPRDWDRFMRFMERYSNENGLQFIKK